MKLKFADILWLHILSHHSPSPSRRAAKSLFNDFLAEHNVSPVYTLPIKGLSKVNEIVKHLRTVGYIAPSGKMEILPKSGELWEQVGTDWKQFPLEIPLNGVRPAWDKALYWRNDA